MPRHQKESGRVAWAELIMRDKGYAQGNKHFLTSEVESVLKDRATHSKGLNTKPEDVECRLLKNALSGSHRFPVYTDSCPQLHVYPCLTYMHAQKAEAKTCCVLKDKCRMSFLELMLYETL